VNLLAILLKIQKRKILYLNEKISVINSLYLRIVKESVRK